MALNIGDKVVCVNDLMQPHTIEELKKNVPNWVKKDEEYTVRAVNNNNDIVKGILLEEIDNPIIFFEKICKFQEPAFAEWRFRKLKPNETMVEIVSEVLEMA